MQIVTKDGQRYSGQPREIVTALRVTSWTAAAYPDNAEYRRVVADRAKMWNGAEVRTDDDRHWLADLEKAGLLTVEME